MFTLHYSGHVTIDGGDGPLSQAEFDLVCGVDAERLPEADQFHWSPTLLEGPDWLVGLGVQTQVDRLDQLPSGSTVGTVLGQLYPALESAFAEGRRHGRVAVAAARWIGRAPGDRGARRPGTGARGAAAGASGGHGGSRCSV